jgi:hypothetical protein
MVSSNGFVTAVGSHGGMRGPSSDPSCLGDAVCHVLDLLLYYARWHSFFFFFFLQAVWLQHAEELAWQAQLYQLRTSQTVLETTVTKLEKQIHGSVTSSLKGLPTPPQ